VGSYENKYWNKKYSFFTKPIHIDIKMLYFKDRDGRDKAYRMYCNQKETKIPVDLIRPYIIDSMKYKIGFSLTP
jgi:hypothetical protein